jgi:hypothetical protein
MTYSLRWWTSSSVGGEGDSEDRKAEAKEVGFLVPPPNYLPQQPSGAIIRPLEGSRPDPVPVYCPILP